MNLLPYILATAGHVDHGKSALVRALTGIDPDRLPEEKARGITIDLGFAHLDLPAPPDIHRLGIVDVPGHEDFVRNMVAGVGSIDLALLVVATDDGWMPQTEEHLQILTYLGVSHAVVALTKADLVDSTEKVMVEVREKIAGTPIADAPIVATSVLNGNGIEELKAAMLQELRRTPRQRDIGKPRMAVDRAFTLHGPGTIVTGTLTGGILSRGQDVIVQPQGHAARIRAMQSYHQQVERAEPGSRVALNLPELYVNGATSGVRRGQVITVPGLGAASDALDVLLWVSPRSQHKPLKDGALVRLHHGTGNTAAFVRLGSTGALAPGDRAVAQLRVESEVYCFAGDRFILRDWAEQRTLAGGTVLDPDASRRGFRTVQRQQFLQQRAAQVVEAESFVASQVRRDGTAVVSNLLLKSPFDSRQLADVVHRLVVGGTVVASGDMIADVAWLRRLRGLAEQTIDAYHQANPQEFGPRIGDLRQALSKPMGKADVLDLLVAELCRDGFVRSGLQIRRNSHRPALPPRLQPAGAKLRATLANRSLDPPARNVLAPDPLSQQALRFLLQSGEAIEVSDELILHADHYRRAIQAVRDYLSTHGAATVSQLKEALNSSRRIMIPLLEKLDRDGVTLRQGDRRVLRQSSSK